MVDNLSNPAGFADANRSTNLENTTMSSVDSFEQELDDVSFSEDLDLSVDELNQLLPSNEYDNANLIDTISNTDHNDNEVTTDVEQSIVVTEDNAVNNDLEPEPAPDLDLPKYSDSVDIYDYNHRPIEPYAYVRFSNEAITLKQSLESLVPFFKRGVLCYHSPLPGIEEDGSFAIAQEFVKHNPGFKLVKYPFPVIFHNWNKMAQYLFTKVRRVWLLDVFYNFALYYLKELAARNGDTDRCWLFKVDTDHIYCQKSLEEIYKFALDNPYYNSLLCYKFNVSRDVRDPSKEPTMWFEALDNGLDHFFTRLDIFEPFNFIYKFDNDPEKPVSEHSIQCWERAIFNLDKVSHCVHRYFITSLHFNKEKYIHYNRDVDLNKVYERGYPYAEMDLDDLVQKAPEVAADPNFYSEAHIKSLYDKFVYQDKEQMRKYGRDGFDYEELFSNPKYTTDYIVKEINQRANDMRAGLIPCTAEELEDADLLNRVLNTIMSDQVMKSVVRMD